MAISRTRAQQNRHVRREALREELKSREYLRQVHAILDDLAERGMHPNEVIRLKTRMQGYFNLLSKTLPDVKAIEMEALFQMPEASRADLEQQLAKYGIDPQVIASTAQTKAH
jgi:hypothetical protein